MVLLVDRSKSIGEDVKNVNGLICMFCDNKKLFVK